MAAELGVFIPVFNGGRLLLETVESCVASSLPAERFHVVVVDNRSTDGATDEVERRYGGRVEVIRNEINLGRVGNWNRCVEMAEQRGFTFFNLLFVGDRWVSGEVLAQTLDRMRHSEAALALSAFEIRDEQNRIIRRARRFTIPERFVEVSGGQFLDATIPTGTIPVAPLQSNLFRVLPKRALRFDPANPTSTDIEATVEFLHRTGRPVLLCSEPFMAWWKHAGRFFMSNDLMKFTADDTAQLRRLSARTARPIDWPVANALLILKMALGIWLFVSPTRWFREGAELVRLLGTRGGGVSLSALFGHAAAHVFLRRSLLRFPAPAGAPAGPGGDSAP